MCDAEIEKIATFAGTTLLRSGTQEPANDREIVLRKPLGNMVITENGILNAWCDAANELRAPFSWRLPYNVIICMNDATEFVSLNRYVDCIR